MLPRKAYDKLVQWKNSPDKKALCIIGARQIGKTTIIREFAKENYEHFVELNFILDPQTEAIFEGSLDANTIIMNLTAYTRKKMQEGKTLVLLDEIQNCPRARSAIKFLVEDGRFDYIESGSLLGVKYKEVPSYPVGFEEIFQMYPMDFEEFLWANGVQTSTLDYLQECFTNREPITTSVHDTMNHLFYNYIVVGGMPAAVQLFVDTHDIGRVIEYQNSILEQYRLDISQYASGSDKLKIKAIFDSIPSQLDDKNRRFYINALDKNARINRYDNSFKWLEEAGVALPCYNVNMPQPPLQLNEKHSLFKLFMNDTGLLCAACMESVQFDLLKGNVSVNMGSILENVMAQQLKANGFNLYYYDSTKLGEIDFVVQNGTKIDLIEIKSGNDYQKHTTLDNVLAVNEWRFNQVYIFCKDNIKVDKNIVYLPWYEIMFLTPFKIPYGTIHEVDISGLK